MSKAQEKQKTAEIIIHDFVSLDINSIIGFLYETTVNIQVKYYTAQIKFYANIYLASPVYILLSFAVL